MSKTERKSEVSRRDTLRLATAVSALGVGLGALLRAKDGSAEVGTNALKLDSAKLGPVSLKLYKLDGEGRAFNLLHTLDLSAFFIKGEAGKDNFLSLKLFNMKGEPSVISTQEFRVGKV